jgi:PIN domain nuclease of toxin-antitoxin system
MSDVLADTHTIVWYLSEVSRLSVPALAALTAAENTGRILVSTISFVELTYLVEKGKVDPAVLAELWAAVSDPTEPVDALPLSLDVIRMLNQIPRAIVPDMPDRIIAATAFAHQVALITADAKLHAAPIPTIW